MRFIIYGAGGVGGVIGARLHQHGYDTILIARGRHLEAIRRDGLRFQSPREDVVFPIPVAGHPSEIDFRDGDVVILTMKSQDTIGALEDLRAAAGDAIPVVCGQNGVANERMAARRFENVYGMMVWLPAVHLEPGIVQCNSSAKSGVLDTGRFPGGVDAVAEGVTAALEASNFSSRPDPAVMRWKYNKLLSNLFNAVDALCGSQDGIREIIQVAREEAIACYRAAGIDWASDEEAAQRRGDLIRLEPIAGQPRAGGSTWQSLARGSTSVEADYLNGEICQLGRLHGVPTPANRVLQRLSNEAARAGRPPGSMTVEELRAAIEAESAALPA